MPASPQPPLARFSDIKLLALFAALCLAGILTLHVIFAIQGRGLYRDQHLGAALLYAANGVDLLHPVIVGFNGSGTPTPLEFPLWQASTGLAMRALGPWWGWGNVISWLLFASSVWPFYRLATQWLGARAAWWSVITLLLQPLIVVQAGQAGTDGTALASSIWFVYLANRMICSGSWAWWVAAALMGALSATQKVPFFMAAGVASVGLLYRQPSRSTRHWLQIVLAGTFATGVFAVWTLHAERQFALAEFPLLDLRVAANPTMHEWYFGSWSYRLDITNWLRGGYRVLQGVCGSFPLLLLVLLGLTRKAQVLSRWWLGGAVLVTFVYCHLVLHHWHYYLMICPAFALLCGGVLAEGEDLLASHITRFSQLLPYAGFIFLAAASVQGLRGGNFLMRDDYPRKMAELIARHSMQKERLLVANGGWGGAELMLARRQGLSIDSTAFLERPVNLDRIRAMGFTKLIALSLSPKRTAVALIGGSITRRDSWESHLTPVTQVWPVIYRDDDICILQIPDPSPPTPSGVRP